MFALGAHPDRVAWGIGLVRGARREAGLDPDGVEYSAYVSAACHPDIGVARDMVRSGLTVAARFSVMHGSVDGPPSEGGRAIIRSMREAYDMHKHTRGDSPQAGILTPEFIDEYAAVGSPDRVLDRLMRLRDLGLSKIVVNGGWRDTKDQEGPKSKQPDRDRSSAVPDRPGCRGTGAFGPETCALENIAAAKTAYTLPETGFFARFLISGHSRVRELTENGTFPSMNLLAAHSVWGGFMQIGLGADDPQPVIGRRRPVSDPSGTRRSARGHWTGPRFGFARRRTCLRSSRASDWRRTDRTHVRSSCLP